MTTTPSKEDWEKARIESELNVFWDIISKNLPKSIERAALGDEKIFRAFRAAYPEIRSYLLQNHNNALVAEIEKLKEDNTLWETMTPEQRLLSSLHKPFKSKDYIQGFNEALDTIIRIIQEK